MPRTVVRLSAGRMNFSFADQALCFMAGANSIFDGDKLLTTPNNDRNEDLQVGGGVVVARGGVGLQRGGAEAGRAGRLGRRSARSAWQASCAQWVWAETMH